MEIPARLRFSREKGIALLVFAGVSLAGFGVQEISGRQEKQRLEDHFADELAGIQIQVLARLNETSSAMRRYAARIEVLGLTNQRYLAVDSQNYLNQLPILSRIGVVDKSFKTLWSYPPDSRAQVQGFDQSLIPERREAFEAARDQKKTVLSRTVELRSGGKGNLLPVGLWRDGRFDGAVYGAVKIDHLLKGLEKPEKFALEFKDGGVTVFKSAAKGQLEPKFEHSMPIPFGLADFSISLTPTESELKAQLSNLPLYVLFLAQLFAVLSAFLVHAYLVRQKGQLIDLEWRKMLLQGVGHAVIATDINGVIQTFTESAERLLGYAAGDVVGRSTLDLFCLRPEMIERAKHLSADLGKEVEPGSEVFIAKLRESREVEEAEWTFIRKNKSHVPVSVLSSAICESKDRIQGYLFIATDMTAQKAAQAEIFATSDRLKRVIEATGEGLWERDLHSAEILYCDSQFRKLMDVESQAAVDFAQVWDRIDPLDHQIVTDALLEAQMRSDSHFDIEIRLRPRSTVEPRRYIRWRGQVVRDGDRSKLVSTMGDITEGVESRLALEAALVQANAGAVARNTFFSAMSHELRTPLNGILGMTDLLLETELNEKQERFAKIVQQSGTNLLTLLNEILDFSKLESGKMQLETTSFDLTEMVESQVEMLAANAAEKNLTLVSFLSPTLPSKIVGDPSRLGQTLLNLISNALKFTSTGGVSVRVAEVTSKGEKKIRFEVRDTGIGLQPDEVERLFQPFVQANRQISARFGGTGLGLSICKKIVEAMNGKIGVESVIGQGSKFWFEVPLYSTSSSAEPRLGWEKLIDTELAIVGQDELSAHMLADYMRSWKMKPAVIPGDSECAEWLQKNRSKTPRIVLVSCRRSADENRKLISQLRTANENVRFVALKDLSDPLESADLLKQGFAEVVDRPIKQSKLFDAMVGMLSEQVVAKAHEPKETRTGRAVKKSEFKILVADDVSVNRLLTTSMLEYLGHSAASVANGAEVLEALKQNRYDLILMDCQMPEMDGFEATALIRKLEDPVLRKIPIVALTANARGEDAKTCLKAGMNAHLAKPVRKEQLAEAVDYWLSVSKSQNAG